VLLGLLAAGLYVVSLQAQYRYVFAVKHESVVSVIEAISLDAGMTVFALLALGLALAGQSAGSSGPRWSRARWPRLG